MLLLLSAGFPPMSTVGAPGAHGAGITGVQGIGVNTPIAAAVAEATAGFVMLEHMPKVGSLLSCIVAASRLQAITVCWDDTGSAAGAAPKEHWHIALMAVCIAIGITYNSKTYSFSPFDSVMVSNRFDFS